MNHYQINLRSIANQTPRNPFEALSEFRAPESESSPLSVLADRVADFLELGIELLHVMPPFVMGEKSRKGIGSPYAIRDPYNIDPEYGTLDDWYRFVRNAHAAGLRVIVGYVPNHTARDHIWIEEDPESFVCDVNGAVTFDFDWSDTAKLDYTRAELRERVADVMNFWVNGACAESGVDGFRMDMAHMLNDLSFWNETIPQCRAQVERPILFLAECYGRERNLDLFQRGFDAAYDDDLYKIAQYGFARDAAGNSLLLFDKEAAEANGDFAQWAAAWKQGGIAKAVAELVSAYNRDEGGHVLARYVDNHDEGRGIYRFGPQAARAMMDLISYLPDTIVFQLAGQESGALNRPPIHEHCGLCDKGYRLVTGDQVEHVDGIEFTGNLYFRTSEERRQIFSEHRNRNLNRRDHPERVNGCFELLNVDEPGDPELRSVIAFKRDELRVAVNLSHLDKNVLIDGAEHTLAAWACVEL